MYKSAVISECGRYRYRLQRTWDDALPALPTLYFVMLNPSTADAEVDDPTIRKCIGFAKQNGFGTIVVLNLFAWRATDPKELTRQRGVDVVGPENDIYLEAIPDGATVVCAWGGEPYSQPRLHCRALGVLDMLRNRNLCCVKRTGNRPWHPLYVKYGELLEFGETAASNVSTQPTTDSEM